MKNFLFILERAWLAAIAAAVGFAVYSAITYKAFNHLVYFPLICAGFCFLIYRNIRGQRQFLDKHKKP